MSGLKVFAGFKERQAFGCSGERIYNHQFDKVLWMPNVCNVLGRTKLSVETCHGGVGDNGDDDDNEGDLHLKEEHLAASSSQLQQMSNTSEADAAKS